MTTKGLPLAKGAPRQRRFLMAVPVTIVTLHRKSDIESGAGVNDIEIISKSDYQSPKIYSGIAYQYMVCYTPY